MNDAIDSDDVADERVERETPRPAVYFTEFVHARRRGLDKLKMPNDKLYYEQLGRHCGIATPERFGVFRSPAEIDFDSLPDRFVLKPTKMSSGRGVLLLARQGKGRFLEARSSRALDAGGIVGLLDQTIKENPRKSNRIIAEAIIEDEQGWPLPIDYKFFIFGEEILFIEHIKRTKRGKAIRFYGGDFGDFSLDGRIKVNLKRVELDEARIPLRPHEMIEKALALARHLRTPFVRADLYAGRAGPVLGEMTRAPGGAYFGYDYRLTEAFDHALGARWAEAAAAVGETVPLIVGGPPSRRLAEIRATISELELRDLQSNLRTAERRCAEAEKKAARLQRMLDDFRRSTSWRITAPLRWPTRAVKALRRRVWPSDRPAP